MLSWIAAPRAGRPFGLDLLPPLCTSRERRPKPDVGNLLSAGACAFTGEPAGHTRMPPGLRIAVTEFAERGFHAPPSGFHGRQEPFGERTGHTQATLPCSYKIPDFAHKQAGDGVGIQQRRVVRKAALYGTLGQAAAWHIARVDVRTSIGISPKKAPGGYPRACFTVGWGGGLLHLIKIPRFARLLQLGHVRNFASRQQSKFKFSQKDIELDGRFVNLLLDIDQRPLCGR